MSSPYDLVAPNEGLPDQLAYIVKAPISGVLPWVLLLWLNADLYPTDDTVYADLTEASFTGYSRVTVDRSLWTDPVLQADAAVTTWGTSPTQWTATGTPQTLYGWAMVTQISPVIRYIQRFPIPIIAADGVPVGVLPRVTLSTVGSCSPAPLSSGARSLAARKKSR